MRHMRAVFEKDFPPPLDNVAVSPRSLRFVKAVARTLNSTKQRARPIQPDELCLLAKKLPFAYPPPVAKLVMFVALLTFWGCLRLGTCLLKEGSLLEVVTWEDVWFDGVNLFVTIFRDKTVREFDDGHRIILKAIPSHPWLCPVQAYLAYARECMQLSLNATAPVAQYAAGVSLSFDEFLDILNALLPGRKATASCKGHFTGHSFRRGHAQAAIKCGIEVQDLMLFGNWKSAPSVRNYTAGAFVASALSDLFRRLAQPVFGI